MEASKFSMSLTSLIPLSAPSLPFSYPQFIVLIQLMAIHLLQEGESKKSSSACHWHQLCLWLEQ